MGKRMFVVVAILFFATLSICAQQSLVGRVYYNANILAGELTEAFKDADKELAKAKAEAIEKGEKKLGRKLNQQELAELDKKVKESQDMMNAMKKGMKTAVTVTFKTDKDLVMNADMKIDDNVMKAAGIGWAKRKMMKLAMAVMPAQKGKYVVKGNTIYIDEGGGERDTMWLSNDGKQLYGKLDKTKFTLNRTK